MARLPDAQALGERPTPTPRGGIVSGPSNAGLGESVQAATATKGVVEFADQLAQAGQRIQRRRDAVEHVNNLGEYETFATEELRKTSLEQDLTKQEVLSGLGERLRQKKTELLSRGGLSPDGMARLEADLEKTRVTHSVQAGGLARVQESKKTALMIGQNVNELASEYLADMANPRKLGEVFGKLDQKLSAYAGALEPQEEIMFARNGRSMIVFGALSMLAETRPDAAEDILSQTPGIKGILSPEHQATVLQKINTARAAMNKETIVPQGSTVLRGGKPIYTNPAKPEPLQLKEIHDPTSPTGRRLVPEAEAVGQPSPEPKPLISNEETYGSAMAKQIAGAHGEKIKEIDKSEKSARSTLSDLATMRTALESGAIEPGFLGKEKMILARALKLVGMETEETRKITGDAATAEILDSGSKRLALQLSENLSRVTNMNLEFLDASLPGLTKTPEGGAVIMGIMAATAKRAIQIASIKDDFIQKHGGLLPKDGSESFDQRIRRLDDETPVISDELKQRIIDLGSKAPQSWDELMNKGSRKGAVPPGMEPPPGYEYVGQRGGKAFYRSLSDKKKTISKPLEAPQGGDNE